MTEGTQSSSMGATEGLGEEWRALGLTLSISVVSMGDTAEPLLPCGVPDLGRVERR